VREPGRAYQVQRRGPVQTNPQQPIEAGEMVHVGVRNETMRDAQELARRERCQITEIEQQRANRKSMNSPGSENGSLTRLG